MDGQMTFSGDGHFEEEAEVFEETWDTRDMTKSEEKSAREAWHALAKSKIILAWVGVIFLRNR